jgi:hypothetical protein
MEKEKQLLVQCRLLIETSLGWGEGGNWGNNDFEQLSDKIFEKTKVQLSVSTLKRIWGKVRYDNFPTSATLNALTGYLGYGSWRDFKQQIQAGESKDEAGIQPLIVKIIDVEQNTNSGIRQKSAEPVAYPVKTKGAIPFLLVATILILVGIIYISSKSKPKPIDPSTIKLEAIKASDGLPNSVVFNYDASAFHSDSVFIQQTWDPKRRERVPGNGKQYTSIYYEPGFFIAKLVVDGDVKKKCPVFIKTSGWKGIIEKHPIPVYLSDKEIKGRGFMGISDSLLRQKTGSPVFNDTWVKYANVRQFKGIDAGNFTFETTMRNSSPVEASACRKVRVLLLGTGKAIILPLADKGCISELSLLTGDFWISGKNHDMRAFGCDFSRFQHLECRVAAQRFKVLLNGKLIIDIAQKATIGEIVGIRFETEGTAEIKDVKLSTPGGANYQEEFK